MNDLSEDNEEIKLKKEEIEKVLQKLESKLQEYDELKKTLEESDINEINMTDPDAKLVKFGFHQGIDVGYNIQAAADAKNNLITTFEVTNNSADQGQLYNMSNKVKSIFDVDSIESLADKGYFEPADLKKCEENKIVSLRALATKATSTLSDTPPSGTRNLHSMEDIIVKMIDLESEINADIDSLVDLKREFVFIIKKINNPEYQTLLELRYLCFKTWEQIAVVMGYDLRYLHKLHGKALENCEINFKEDTKRH
jgi:hypothetical protein